LRETLRNVRWILYLGYLSLPIIMVCILSRVPISSVIIFKLLFGAIASFWLVANSQRFHRAWIRFIAAFLPAVFLFFFKFLELISYYLQGESFNDRFFYHLSLTSLEVGARAYGWMLLTPVAITLIAGFLDFRLSRKTAICTSRKCQILSWILVLLAIIFLPNVPKSFAIECLHTMRSPARRDVGAIIAQLKERHVNVEAFSPQNVRVDLPTASKNLLLIYLESLESSYLDEARFPGLVPNIKQAMANGLQFDNLSQFDGTDWTVAGMVASQCGIPLAVMGNDSIYQNRALKNMVGLGDVLNEAGYYQVYMGGADLEFAGKGGFYATHGYQEVLGYKELKPKAHDSSYETGWGLYDDTVFDMALEQFNALSQQRKNFNLTLLTLDTHHPCGNASKSCPAYSRSTNSMLQAVHCTDFLFGKFLAALQKSERYKDTLIFVMSDHLAMENVAMPLYPNSPRKLVAFALNAGVGKINMAGSHFDIAPTMLDLLQIKTNALFPLGQSLLKPEQPDRFAVFRENGYELLKSYFSSADKEVAPIHINAGHGITTADMPPHTVSVGGQSIIMSLDGWPVDPEDHIFIMRCTLDGQVQKHRIATEAEAARMVEASPDAVYFMLTRTAQIPFGLFPGKPNDQWHWYLGNPSSAEGMTGEASQFDAIMVQPAQCQKILQSDRRNAAQLFAIRKQVQSLNQSLQVAQQQSATAYGHFCPARIDVVSNSAAGGESYITLDDLLLKAENGITLVVIDPLKNNIIHHRSYSVTGSPQTANELMAALRQTKKDTVVITVAHGKVDLPQTAIKAFEKLGARQISGFKSGQPYILIARAGGKAVFEEIGEPGTAINKSLSVLDSEGTISAIKQLWNEHNLVVQSASLGCGKSYVLVDNFQVPRIGRGLNAVVFDAATKAVKFNDQFDTYDDINAIKKLDNALQRTKPNDIVIVVADDSATGGPLGTSLPGNLEASLKKLGAVCAGEIRFRTPYIFMTKVGSDFHIEKCSQTEGILQVELSPQEARHLFSGSVPDLTPERLHIRQ
jgi:hypothetical protein